MKHIGICWLLTICMQLVIAQNTPHYQASPGENGTIRIDKTGQVQPGWSLSVNNNWLPSAPVLADLADSGDMENTFGVRTVSEIHVVKADGRPLNEHWTAEVNAVPAFTPSVGDINNDGTHNITAGSSDGYAYAFDLVVRWVKHKKLKPN